MDKYVVSLYFAGIKNVFSVIHLVIYIRHRPIYQVSLTETRISFHFYFPPSSFLQILYVKHKTPADMA
jgi:hypothetical protein